MLLETVTRSVGIICGFFVVPKQYLVTDAISSLLITLNKFTDNLEQATDCCPQQRMFRLQRLLNVKHLLQYKFVNFLWPFQELITVIGAICFYYGIRHMIVENSLLLWSEYSVQGSSLYIVQPHVQILYTIDQKISLFKILLRLRPNAKFNM